MNDLICESTNTLGIRSRWYRNRETAVAALAAIPVELRGTWTVSAPLETSPRSIWRVDDQR